MPEIDVISNNAQMLLTSVGPNTPEICDAMQDLARIAGWPYKKINILRIADCWTNFNINDGTTRSERTKQRFEARGTRKWSDAYLKYVLGNVTVSDIYAGKCDEEGSFEDELIKADMLWIPGGNTYLGMRSLGPYTEAIRRRVADGLPSMFDSAGSIMAGKNIRPATLEPADTRPNVPDLDETGLCLVDADIVTHAAGRVGKICMRGLDVAIASIVFRLCETPQSLVDDYVYNREAEGVHVYTLNDAQALLVSGSKTVIL